MERDVGNIRVRNVGTIGGNLCFADPHSDPATYLIAAGAHLIARRGRRRAAGDRDRGVRSRAVPECARRRGAARRRRGSGAVTGVGDRPSQDVVPRAPGDHGRGERDRSAMAGSPRPARGRLGRRAHRCGLRAAERVLVGARRERARRPAARCSSRRPQPTRRSRSPTPTARSRYKRQLVRVLVGRCARQAVAEASDQAAG